jgi:hypothetical protein
MLLNTVTPYIMLVCDQFTKGAIYLGWMSDGLEKIGINTAEFLYNSLTCASDYRDDEKQLTSIALAFESFEQLTKEISNVHTKLRSEKGLTYTPDVDKLYHDVDAIAKVSRQLYTIWNQTHNHPNLRLTNPVSTSNVGLSCQYYQSSDYAELPLLGRKANQEADFLAELNELYGAIHDKPDWYMPWTSSVPPIRDISTIGDTTQLHSPSGETILIRPQFATQRATQLLDESMLEHGTSLKHAVSIIGFSVTWLALTYAHYLYDNRKRKKSFQPKSHKGDAREYSLHH